MLFTNLEAGADLWSFANEHGLSIKGHEIDTKNIIYFEPQLEKSFLTNFIAHVNGTRLKEYDLLNIVQLLKYNLLIFWAFGLHVVKDLYHEFLVVNILPCAETYSMPLKRWRTSFEKCEEVSELKKKFREQKLIYADLHFIGQLLKHVSILFIVDSKGKVSVMCPSVGEVVFNSLL